MEKNKAGREYQGCCGTQVAVGIAVNKQVSGIPDREVDIGAQT